MEFLHAGELLGVEMRKMSYGALTSSFVIIPPLMLRLFVRQCFTVCLLRCWVTRRFKDTESVRRSPNAPFLDMASRGPESRTKQHLDDITNIRFQRSPRQSGERAAREGGWQERPAGLIRIFLSQSDEPHRQVTVLENGRV